MTLEQIPSCAGDNTSHKFEATYEVEGGCESNPGTMGLGGRDLEHKSHCVSCNVTQTEIIRYDSFGNEDSEVSYFQNGYLEN